MTGATTSTDAASTGVISTTEVAHVFRCQTCCFSGKTRSTASEVLAKAPAATGVASTALTPVTSQEWTIFQQDITFEWKLKSNGHLEKADNIFHREHL